MAYILNKECYQSVHVSLNILNKLRKRNKLRGLLKIVSLFQQDFNKFNNTGARMLGPIYNMTLKLFRNRIFAWKRQDFAMHDYVMDVV